jgi:Tol biopolymer transport system component
MAGVLAMIAILAIGAAYAVWFRPRAVTSASTSLRALTRITFEEGLQGQPTWSPDGKFIAYMSNQGGNVDIWVQPVAGGRAIRVTSDPANDWQPDWSPDGNHIVFRSERDGGGIFIVPAVCKWNVDDVQPQRVRFFGDPDYHIWQARYSPDGKWILFNAQDAKQSSVSILGVMPAGGGAWRRLTRASVWADKPRWAPDGKTIYFVSNRDSAFFDVWGIGFDPVKGTTVGEEFRVTRFVDPARRVQSLAISELGVSRDRLIVPILERSSMQSR